MDALTLRIGSQLEQLSRPLALKLPGGQRVGPANAQITLTFTDWSALRTLAAGQIRTIAALDADNGGAPLKAVTLQDRNP